MNTIPQKKLTPLPFIVNKMNRTKKDTSNICHKNTKSLI